MTETPQKQAGLIFIVLGGFLFLFIFLFLYFRASRIPGFPEFLPVKQTVAFFEFPLRLDSVMKKKINEILKVDWEKDIAPLGGKRGALALLRENEESEKLLPFLLLEAPSNTAAIGHNMNFDLLGNVLILSPSQAGLKIFYSYQSSGHQHLSSDRNFMKIRQNVFGEFFAYVRPKEIPAAAITFFARFLPQTPEIPFIFEAVGIGIQKKVEVWLGNSYALSEQPLKKTGRKDAHELYRASLLPYLPEDFDFLLSGQNLPAQLEKIGAGELTKLALQKYLPGVNFKKEVVPLISSEFAFTKWNEHELFVATIEVTELRLGLRAAFAKTIPQLASKTREVKLPDGTIAKEFIPDPDALKSFAEDFRGIAIKGFTWGKNEALYDAVTAGKWFVSNDLTTLKKALLLTQEPGRNFRESKAYRTFLQPILKNPELLGVAISPGATFGFSKRMFEDHMEANFVLNMLP